jgi:hypothetical protein
MGRNLDWLPVTTGIKVLDDLKEAAPAFSPVAGRSAGGAAPPASPRQESALGKRYKNYRSRSTFQRGQSILSDHTG